MGFDEHVVELLPAYALDCLDEKEILFVSEHLTACAECRSELRAYNFVVDQLPLTVPQSEPPPIVKQRLMQRVGTTARLTGRSEKLQRSWLQRLLFPFSAWRLASLALILILLTSNLLLWQQVSQLRSVPQTALYTVNLSSTGVAPGATGLLIISLDGSHGTLVVDRLPPLHEDQQYQLWLIKDGQRSSGGVFSVSRDGYGSMWVASEEPLAAYPEFGITIEPAGGSPGPTGEKVLGGEL